MKNTININAIPKFIAKIQIVFITCLIALHLYHIYYFYFEGVYYSQFDLNWERNLPTLYASLILLFCALCLFYIAYKKIKEKNAYKHAWLLLGVIFAFLSYDEYFQFHDPLSKVIRNHVAVPDTLFFAWVIPYSFFTLVFILIYLKFWINLPKPYRLLFFLSGSIFVIGAIGLEMVGAPYAVQWGRSNTFYAYFTTVEETLEMVGIALFLYTLVRYMCEFYFNRTLIQEGEDKTELL
jgi:hypothetical protein